jgi:hypothetical protein
LPSIADVLFLLVVLRALHLGQSELLNDPGTGWHIRVGLDVWQAGPPQVDRYSYTRAQQPWLSQHWLCDALLALVYQARGWNGLVICSAIVLGWTYRYLFRTVLSAPANVAWAAALTLLAAGCAAPHWLARPHLLSLFFFLLTFRACWDYHRYGSRGIWAMPILMAVWCNVHGAFLAGLMVVSVSLLGQLLTPMPDRASYRRRLIGFSAVLVLSLLATLVNPYGLRLHTHLSGILFSSQVRDLIDEWRAPDFQAGETRPLEIMLLLALCLLALAQKRPGLFSLVHLVTWIHFGLQAVRQVALTSMIAAPVLGELTSGSGEGLRQRMHLGRLADWMHPLGARAEAWAAEERAARVPVVSGVVTVILLVLSAIDLRIPALGMGTARLAPERWPIEAVARLRQQPATAPLFHDLNWGGYLILMAHPDWPVFADDRFELYGREFLVEYLDALEYGASWQSLFDRYRFGYVLVPPEAPLARVLRQSADWEVLHQDATAVLLRHVPAK